MKVSPKVKKIWNTITTILVAIVVIITILLVGVRLAGFKVYTVLSGSMEPTFHVGSLVYVKSVAPESIQVGDPITFVMDENLTVATHRVVGIDAENQHFTTKGDANDNVDAAPVHFKNLIGKAVYSIPYLGYVSNWIQHSPGMYITTAIMILLLIAVFVPDIVDKGVKKRTELAVKLAREQLEKEAAEAKTAGENKPLEGAAEVKTE